ncbi:MAG: histidine phosphatase family protein [Pirellulales bacterium]
MLEIILIRPGSTDFDQQGRIQGNLDIPMNECGHQEVLSMVESLRGRGITHVYFGPCQAAVETGEVLAANLGAKRKPLDSLTNLDHGLWQGLRLEEVKHKHPKVFRQWEESPESVCPPEGEPLCEVEERVQANLRRLLKKHREGCIALVAPEPLLTILRSFLTNAEIGSLCCAGTTGGIWESLPVDPPSLALTRG